MRADGAAADAVPLDSLLPVVYDQLRAMAAGRALFCARFHPEDSMTARPQGIPENSSVVIPRLVCRDVAAEIDFCASTFAAVELGRRSDSDGTVVHALMTIGPAMIMIEGESSMMQSRAPAPDGSSPVVIFVYVEDVDRTVERALDQGARLLMPAQNQFWGDRIAWIMDPAGHVWTIASRIEATTEAERDSRWADILSDQPKS